MKKTNQYNLKQKECRDTKKKSGKTINETDYKDSKNNSTTTEN